MANNTAQRPKFYEGQYLGAEDLEAIVRYQKDRNARHDLGAHTWGIVAGLQLKEVESPAGGGEVDVFIQPGYAWDGLGRAVVVLTPHQLQTDDFKKEVVAGPVKVWLRYMQNETDIPAPGFQSCGDGEEFARIEECFDVVIGDFRHSDQHDEIGVAGEAVDAAEAFYHLDSGDLLLPDESIPWQMFPVDDSEMRWLIPLGYVNWEPGAAGMPGRFVETTDEAVLKKSRSERIYGGAVAENIYAADGVIRLRRRGVPLPASGIITDIFAENRLAYDSERDLVITDDKLQSVDLVWVEGKLRALDDIRPFGSKIDFRNAEGEEGYLWLRRIEDNELDPAGKDLQVVINNTADAGNRFAVGILGAAADDPLQATFVVGDNGNVGVGLDEAQELLHIFSDDDPTLKIETAGKDGLSGRIAFRQNEDSGADIYYDDTAGKVGLMFDTVDAGDATNRMIIKEDGNVGIATLTPDHLLQIGDAIATVSMSLRGPD